MPKRKRQYWLMKSEPDVYSIDDLFAEPTGQTPWDSIRNYQARNFMRDEMAVGDFVLFYHSNAKPPGVAGLAQVASEAYPDPTQFDPDHKYFDPKSDPENPRWMLVDVAPLDRLERLVPLDELKGNPKLAGMATVQKGSRLSVQPVTGPEWREVLKMGGYRGKLAK
ncbi:MAG: EVE domain-containing protein [Planctomycetota bacterium]|nr:EVE domain-containing protein [Planctomycetota bacterium]